MKTYNLYKALLFAIIPFIAFPVMAQSGSYTLNPNNLYTSQTITIPANVPVKVTYSYNQNTFAYIVAGNISYEEDGPYSGQFTVISTTGQISVYCSDEGNGGPYQFTLNWVAGSYSIAEDSYIHGNSVVDGNLSIGSLNTFAKLGILSNKQYSIYSNNSFQTANGSYGLFSYVANSSGPVYGLYSMVSGGGSSNQRYAGYFYGGNVVVIGGNMGIGTTTPNTNNRLEVVGRLRVNGDIYGSNALTFQDDARFTVTPSNVSSLNSSSFSMPQYGIAAPNCGGSADLWISGNNAIRLFTAGNPIPRMSVLNNGYVGIGTNNPDKMLTVNGTIHAKEVLVNVDIPADFVFHPSYNLMPLSLVEQYVKTNSHLPEIPSAAEITKNGLSIGEMQNKLLQKIEELTLYVIEQQKRIEMLEKNQK